MEDHVDVKGASGRVYRFMRLKEGRPLSPAGGNYLYGRHTGARFEPIFAGEAQNLMQDACVRWAEAVERYQATCLYTRLNLGERVRQLEQADIIAGAVPPMNGEPTAPAPIASAPIGGPSAALAGGGEDRVEFPSRCALGEGAEGPLTGDLPGRAQEFAPGGGGERPADADPPHA